MGVHHLLYSVFTNGSQPSLEKQVKFFEEYGFEFLPSGFVYFDEEGELQDKENNIVVNSTEQLVHLPNEIGNGVIQNWDGGNGVGFTIGYVQSGERVIGIIDFLQSEIELIHNYLHAKGTNLVSFMCRYHSEMKVGIIFGGTNHGLLYSDLLLCINSQLNLLPEEVGFFLISEDSVHIPSPHANMETMTLNGKKIYMNWPFSK